MSKPKGAGDLRQRVRFERRTEVEDGYGNVQGEWMSLDIARWCSLTPTRGGESVQAGRLTGTASWDLWMRNDAVGRGLGAGDRVVDVRTGQTFNITFGPADMDGDRAWLFLQLQSGVADG